MNRDRRERRSTARVVGLTLIAALGGCKSAEPAAPVARLEYSAVMAGVARHFELFGKAAQANRFELAQYALDEMAEAFQDQLPFAAPPSEGHPEVLGPLAKTFAQTTLPELQQALVTKDAAQIAAAFMRTAATCNSCHQASGHGFLEVPQVAGRSIPNTDPL